jgi:hypothetical protein
MQRVHAKFGLGDQSTEYDQSLNFNGYIIEKIVVLEYSSVHYSPGDQLFARAKDGSTISIIIRCAKILFAHVLRFQ